MPRAKNIVGNETHRPAFMELEVLKNEENAFQTVEWNQYVEKMPL